MDRNAEMQALRAQMEEIEAKLMSLGNDQADAAVNKVKAGIDRASSTVKRYMDDASGQLHEKADVARQRIVEGTHEADRFAHDNPWQVAALGAVVGLALGSLLSRNK